MHLRVADLRRQERQPEQLPNPLVNHRPVHRIVLIELLDEVWVHDLGELLPVVHHCEVGLVVLTVADVRVVFVVGGADPEVAVQVGLQGLN